MANSNTQFAKYQYVVTAAGPQILPVGQGNVEQGTLASTSEEDATSYNPGGYLNISLNDLFKHSRYRVLRKLGWGHFSTVWLVKDSITNRHSALKVVKSAQRYAETARDEIKLLSKVSNASPDHPGRNFIVSFLDSFTHSPSPGVSHICIVFEPLGENLLALIERNKKKGVPRALVKLIARQVLLGLEYLHDECDLVHTDIKPENILISIPDIENHIHSELSASPSPTSRRVGVPLPLTSKSRQAVSIPSRRQVQIFDSQPLSSPGRGSSGTNSTSGSFIAQMHMSRLAGSHGTLGGSPIKLTQTSPIKLTQSQPDLAAAKSSSNPGPVTNLGLAAISPSASSSSSSVSSTTGKGGTHSEISTPPTSVSHSLGTASGLGMSLLALTSAHKNQSGISNALQHEANFVKVDIDSKIDSIPHSTAIPSIPHSSPVNSHSSWTEKISSSWKSSASFSSSGRSSGSGSGSAVKKHAKRSSILGGGWKDPGAAAPAPALVINESVHGGSMTATDMDDNDPSQEFRSTRDDNSTRSSSKTVTLGGNITQQQRDDLLNKPYTAEPRTSVTIPSTPSSSRIHNSKTATPSLLSQTAPGKGQTPPRPALPHQRSILNRLPPPLKASQLSAHIHDEAPCSYGICAANSSHTHVHNPEHVQQPRSSHLHNRGGKEVSMESMNNNSINNNKTSSPTSLTPTTSQQISIPPTNISPTEEFLPPPISIKIADLGNATPSKKHYTEDIQTRQYRAPEAIIGRKDWGTRVDVWSVACVVFELLTAEYLFDPQGQGELFTKDDDHMAQIIELLGDFSLDVKMGGKYSQELFDRHGGLRFIKTLKPWPLKRVMTEKYIFSESEALDLCAFLEPMLAVDMRKRKEAREMVDHTWLTISEADDFIGQW